MRDHPLHRGFRSGNPGLRTRSPPALRQCGLRIPADVSIVGCDDIELARFTDPPLTSVRISFEDIGAAAVRPLLSRIGGEADIPPAVDLPVELMVRGSTGPARTR